MWRSGLFLVAIALSPSDTGVGNSPFVIAWLLLSFLNCPVPNPFLIGFLCGLMLFAVRLPDPGNLPVIP